MRPVPGAPPPLFSRAAERSPALAEGSVDHVRITTELRSKQAGEWRDGAFGGDQFARLVEQVHGDQGSGQPGGPPKAPGESPHTGSHNKGPAWDARRVGEAVTDWGASAARGETAHLPTGRSGGRAQAGPAGEHGGT